MRRSTEPTSHGNEPGRPVALGYQPALDGLRALAALSVVGFHLRVPGFDGGSLGVDMFFVLSGFLISGLILREVSARGSLSFSGFYLRRGLRLLPAYFAVVAVCVAGDVLVVDAGGTLRGALFSFLYVANWAAALGAGMGTLGHTWSLSVEEQFYLLWPVLLVGATTAARRWRTSLPAIIAAACALAWAGAAYAVFAADVEMGMLNNATQFRAAELLTGCTLAAVLLTGDPRRRVWTARSAPLAGVVSLVGLVALVMVGAPTSTTVLLGTWVGVSVFTTALIASVRSEGSPAARLLSVGPLVLVGKMSYGLYLWHYPVLVSIDAAVGLDSLGAKLLAATLTALVVPASYYWLETPFLRLKSRVGAQLSSSSTSSAYSPTTNTPLVRSRTHWVPTGWPSR
ncbi:acyltransferase family protein [Nocardioides currus]|uniref:Acyltransferase 3 domain-containing protein n=1 Tax=Nocardioides currus TaxID=2133958 RepID=A0A2R7YYW5_9ACTN|nr:acyltransferase [Nocardioides currus]PUA81575.1 hypothetical protein C7S10_05730 [Nocardioides currus]